MAKDVKKTIEELTEKLDTIGMFMLGEIRHFLRRTPSVSREEFVKELNKISKSMEQSGKMATEDVSRAAEQIKGAWSELNEESKQDWKEFSDELETKLSSIEDLTKESFELCVNQAKESLDRRWTALGRVGEDRVKSMRSAADEITSQVKDQWESVKKDLEPTGSRMERAMRAAWKELVKEK